MIIPLNTVSTCTGTRRRIGTFGPAGDRDDIGRLAIGPARNEHEIARFAAGTAAALQIIGQHIAGRAGQFGAAILDARFMAHGAHEIDGFEQRLGLAPLLAGAISACFHARRSSCQTPRLTAWPASTSVSSVGNSGKRRAFTSVPGARRGGIRAPAASPCRRASSRQRQQRRVSGSHSSTWTYQGGDRVNSSHIASPVTMAPTIRMRKLAAPSPTLNWLMSSPQTGQRGTKAISR